MFTSIKHPSLLILEWKSQEVRDWSHQDQAMNKMRIGTKQLLRNGRVTFTVRSNLMSHLISFFQLALHSLHQSLSQKVSSMFQRICKYSPCLRISFLQERDMREISVIILLTYLARRSNMQLVIAQPSIHRIMDSRSQNSQSRPRLILMMHSRCQLHKIPITKVNCQAY